MKGKIFIIVAAIVLAFTLTAFVVFPTNEKGKVEKVQTTENVCNDEDCEYHCTCSHCSSDGGWIRHQDNCGRCHFDYKTYSFYCGKCGTRMNTGNDKYVGGYLYTTCTCPKCSHYSVFKKKS